MSRKIHAWLSAALTALVCGGLLAAVALVPAPPTVVVLVIVVSLGCSMAVAYELAHSAPARPDPRVRFRRELDRIPETEHPLGL